MKKSEMLLAKIRNGETLTNKEKLSLIVNLSIPSILAQITSTLMFFIDASMVGSLGANASAAVGVVETTTWLFGSLMSSAAMGFGVQVAHSIGANDFKKARMVMRSGVVTVLIFALCVLAVGVGIHAHLPYWLKAGADIAPDASLYFLIYACSLPLYQMEMFCMNMLKSSGNMKTPSVISIMMCVLDVVFNFFCIYPTRQIDVFGLDVTVFGLGLGVAGAAVGTGLAFLVSMVLLIRSTFFKSPILALHLDGAENMSWKPDVAYLKRAFVISAPLALQNCLLNGAQMVSTRIVAPLGNIALSANSLGITAESLCYMPGFGIAEAATTLVGQSVGAKRIDLCKSLAYRCVAIGMAVMAFMGVIMYVAAPELMAIMTPVPEIIELGTKVLRIEAFAEPMFAAAIVCAHCMVGAGDTMSPAIINLCSMWGVRLTIAYWLAPVWGLAGAWTGMAVELSFRGLMFLIRLWRGSWLKKAMRTA